MIQTYVAILRGINVSGKNMLKMPALVEAMENAGLKNVRTYLQSGNMVFESEKMEKTALAETIKNTIAAVFKLEVPVIVLDTDYLLNVRNENPFLKREELDVTKLHITFLSARPDGANIEKIDAGKFVPDEFVIVNQVVYLYCPGSYGTTKLNNNFFENKLKTMGTTRNWNTVNKLVELGTNTL